MKLLSCALLACATAVQAYQLTRTAPRTVPRVASIRAEAAAPTADDKLVAFNKFLEKKGIVSDKVQAATLPGWGVCLVAGPDGIESGDTLLSVPTSLHLTPDKVRDSPIGAAVEDVVKADDESALLALGLLGELGGGEASCSCWPYIDLLPGEDAMNGMPLLWSDDDRTKLLGGSHLDGCVEGAREMLLAQWAVIEQAVLPNHPPELFPREVRTSPPVHTPPLSPLALLSFTPLLRDRRFSMPPDTSGPMPSSSPARSRLARRYTSSPSSISPTTCAAGPRHGPRSVGFLPCVLAFLPCVLASHRAALGLPSCC